MKNFKPEWEDIRDLCESHIIQCKYSQHQKELEVMEQKAIAICNSTSFKDYAHELIFRDAFIKGYLSAFIISDEEQKILDSISPLGKALSETKE